MHMGEEVSVVYDRVPAAADGNVRAGERRSGCAAHIEGRAAVYCHVCPTLHVDLSGRDDVNIRSADLDVGVPGFVSKLGRICRISGHNVWLASESDDGESVR